MNRRHWFTHLGLGTAGAAFGMLAAGRGEAQAAESPEPKAGKASGPVKITRVRAIATAPQKTRLVVVRVDTSEPGLYGLGCATFNQRPLPVVSAVNDYLDPFARGRDVDNIEDLWQNAYTSSYWRNGPVLNCALCGLDQALWDIKGKRAGMPVYQLLGGKSRFAVDCYGHASGRDLKELEESVQKLMAEGFRHVRIQLGAYGSPQLSTNPAFRANGFGLPKDQHMDVAPYLKSVPRMFEKIRGSCGEDVELLHDVHERIEPVDAIRLLKEVERYRPFFIEDPLSPEDNAYFHRLREASAVPIAMGELFNSPQEWIPLIKDRLIDFIRVHLSQTGGFTVMRKVAALAEWFNVRTAWHGPGDLSPVGHAANAHLDLAIHNFGIQEVFHPSDTLLEVFPGSPTVKGGYMFVNEAPGFGVDFNEEAAKKFPLPENPGFWEPVRRRDGTAVRP
ncbi:MAG TPA: starvation-sensing protein RspA [Verrucomicrobiales bacterium]|nr:starvation-sensing protein RspA [Verrucomicrobiales bacterium]